jgi:hypothetical protein
MGGKALKNTYTERKNTEEFLRIGKKIQDKILTDIFLETVILKCYGTKADHGDLDLLIKITPNLNINWRTYIQTAFNPNEIYSNGGVYSFDYQNFQIDFIPIKKESWNIAQAYGFFDPLGNIMGKTFHKFGCSYGWEGLYYKYRNYRGTNSANILLTNDVRKIFEFGGYNYDRYLLGFDTLVDIFKFAIDCKYFDTEMFQMENLKSIDKKRNRKRKSYHVFLEYLKENNINTKYPFEEDKDLYIADIDAAFPEANLLEQLHDLQVKDEFNQALTEKFNGNIIMQWIPELQGRELGEMIGEFKMNIGADYNNYILTTDIEEIHTSFMKVYDLYKSNGEK